MAAMSAGCMMWLHELRPDAARKLVLAVPQTYRGIPDLLQQARWGLEWLLKMQNPDGSVLHKIEAADHLASGLRSRIPFPASSMSHPTFTRVISSASCCMPPAFSGASIATFSNAVASLRSAHDSDYKPIQRRWART